MNTSAVIRSPVEVRFPLDLAPRLAPIQSLYQEAKLDTWSPDEDIAWGAFDPASSTTAQRDAACAVWSRRTWLEYTGIAETPALLLRFCLERAREVDPKYFLTVRNTEEAMLVECFERYAGLLGSGPARPVDPAWEAVINRGLYRDALNADVDLDAYVAVHCAIEDGFELELFRAYQANAAEPVARRILDRSVRVKTRHAAFGWHYLEGRAARFGERQRAALADAGAAWLQDVAFAGYHVPSLATSIDSAGLQEAQALAAAGGLGAATAAAEEQILREYLAGVRPRLRALGLDLPQRPHARLGLV